MACCIKAVLCPACMSSSSFCRSCSFSFIRSSSFFHRCILSGSGTSSCSRFLTSSNSPCTLRISSCTSRMVVILKKGKIQQKHFCKNQTKKNRPERNNSHKEEQAKAGKLNPSPSTTRSTMLLLLHLSPPPSKLLLLEQSTRQASSSSSSSSWCDVKIEMMRQHFQPQTPILAEAQQWSLRLPPPIYPTKPRKQAPNTIGQQALEEEEQQRTRQTLLLGAKLRWFLKLFCVPLRLALLACLLACFRKGFALGSYVKAGDGVKEEEEEEALA